MSSLKIGDKVRILVDKPWSALFAVGDIGVIVSESDRDWVVEFEDGRLNQFGEEPEYWYLNKNPVGKYEPVHINRADVLKEIGVYIDTIKELLKQLGDTNE